MPCQIIRCAIVVIAAMLPGWSAAAAELYEASTIVTGTVAETRSGGLASCLREVLVKVSGNPTLADDPRLAALDGKVADLVEDFAYIDRMSDLPHHDEQGSRDRPFTLIVHFSPPKIDAALARLGEQPWRGERRLLVRITVRDRSGTYPMTADGDDDERQREALLAAAERYGMRVVLLPAHRAKLAHAGVANTVPLTGTLAWSDTAFGWVGAWHLTWRGRDHAWGISGVSFDAAFRDAMQGALAVLSGHAGRSGR
jgi:hypothetical protein